jgi:hypothetical protein
LSIKCKSKVCAIERAGERWMVMPLRARHPNQLGQEGVGQQEELGQEVVDQQEDRLDQARRRHQEDQLGQARLPWPWHETRHR